MSDNAKFSRDRFDKFDSKAKKWSKVLLEQLGARSVTKTKGNERYDLEASVNGKPMKFEVEVKQDWGKQWKVSASEDGWMVSGKKSDMPFPFPDIRYTARKKDNPVDYFITFSGCGKYALMAPSEDVKKSKIQKIDNKHMSNEPFMVFSLKFPNKFAFFELGDEGWFMIFHWCGRRPKCLSFDNVFDPMSDCLFLDY